MSETNGFLVVRDLQRSFGRTRALDGLCLSVPKHKIAAFVGANGAGKTTTFSIIGGFIRADAGTITVDGTPLRAFSRHGGAIGLLPQDVQFFETRSVSRQLYLFARLAGYSSAAAKKEVSRVLELVRLEEKARAKPQELSRGMKVRLGVAQALIGEPKLVLLDEPTAGLDPKMIAAFREIVRDLSGKTTLVISSHDLHELETLCDYVCMIDQGRLITEGPLEEILCDASRVEYEINGSFELEDLRSAISQASFAYAGNGKLTATFDSSQTSVSKLNKEVLKWLLDNDVAVVGVKAQRSLEETYLERV